MRISFFISLFFFGLIEEIIERNNGGYLVLWEGRGGGEAFRGGAKTRIGFQRATRKWEVGPLYTRARMASGEAGPGRRRQKKSLKKRKWGGHPGISMAKVAVSTPLAALRSWPLAT